MSVESIKIECDTCKFSGSSGVTNGVFAYATPDGSVPIMRNLAWCELCQRIVAAELLPTDADYSAALGKLGSVRKEIVSEVAELQSTKSFLGRLLSRPWSEKLVLLQSSETEIQQHLEDIEQIRKHVNCERKSRCLSCGSESIKYLPSFPLGLGDVWSGAVESTPLGMKHPNCGGEFVLKMSGIRLNIRFTEKLYTVDGIRETEHQTA